MLSSKIKTGTLFFLSLVIIIILSSRSTIGQDFYAHLDRVDSTIFSIKNGQLIPFFVYNLDSSYFGYSWNLFYPPLSLLFMIIAKGIYLMFGNNPAYNYFFIYHFIVIAIGYLMTYLSLRDLGINKSVAHSGALMFITFHYFMVNLLIRSAYPEALAMCFYPLVISGLYLKSKGVDNFTFIIGLSLITITHIPSTVIALVFCILFFIFNDGKRYLIKTFFKKDLYLYLILTAWFIFPMLYQISWIHPAIDQPKGLASLSFYNSIVNENTSFKSVLGIGFLCFAALIFMGVDFAKKNQTFGSQIFPVMFSLFLIILGFIRFEILDFIQFAWRFSGIFIFPSIVVLIIHCGFDKSKVLIICVINAILTAGCVSTMLGKHKEYKLNYINSYYDYIDLSAKNKKVNPFYFGNDIAVKKLTYSNGYPNYTVNNQGDAETDIATPVIYYKGIDVYVNNTQQFGVKDGRFAVELESGINTIRFKINTWFELITLALYFISIAFITTSLFSLFIKKHKKTEKLQKQFTL